MFSTALVSVHLRKAVRSNMIRIFSFFLIKAAFVFKIGKWAAMSPALNCFWNVNFSPKAGQRQNPTLSSPSAQLNLPSWNELFLPRPSNSWDFWSSHFAYNLQKKSGYKCLSKNVNQQQHPSTPSMERTKSVFSHLGPSIIFWFEHWLNLELQSYNLNWEIKGFPEQLPHFKNPSNCHISYPLFRIWRQDFSDISHHKITPNWNSIRNTTF